jgi:hypothetical protein
MRSTLAIAIALFALPHGCFRSSNLENKARCAAIGRAFVKDLEQKTGGFPTLVSPEFAYNTSSDTCLCRYQLFYGPTSVPHDGSYKSTSTFIIIDTLSNATIDDVTSESDQNTPEWKHYLATVAAMSADQELPPPLKNVPAAPYL